MPGFHGIPQSSNYGGVALPGLTLCDSRVFVGGSLGCMVECVWLPTSYIQEFVLLTSAICDRLHVHAITDALKRHQCRICGYTKSILLPRPSLIITLQLILKYCLPLTCDTARSYY